MLKKNFLPYQILTVDDIVKGPSQLIACQKHERLIADSNAKLPPLGTSNMTCTAYKTALLWIKTRVISCNTFIAKSRSTAQKPAPLGMNNSSNTNVPLPPLSPTKKRIKKHMRKRTVSKKRKKKIFETDIQDQGHSRRDSRLQFCTIIHLLFQICMMPCSKFSHRFVVVWHEKNISQMILQLNLHQVLSFSFEWNFDDRNFICRRQYRPSRSCC